MKRMLLALKLSVTAGLCAFIVLRADWNLTLEVLRNARGSLLLLVLMVMVSGISISAFRWGLLLAIHGDRPRFRELQRYYFIGMFLNNFLPTSVGGDSYRIYKTWSASVSGSSAVSAVLVERVIGVSSMLFLALAGAGWDWWTAP